MTSHPDLQRIREQALAALGAVGTAEAAEQWRVAHLGRAGNADASAALRRQLAGRAAARSLALRATPSSAR